MCVREREGGRERFSSVRPHTNYTAYKYTSQGEWAIRIFDYQRQVFVCVCVLLVYAAIGQELKA
jgi:hypothetical protein